MKTKVFISNSEILDQSFLDFCVSNGIELLAKSLIDFKPVSHDSAFDADVVFFSSPRSVEFFIASIYNKNLQCACLGKGTAKRLADFGYTSDFVGSASGQPEVVAEEFLSWLKNRKVIFPLSAQSNHSISGKIPDHQKTERIVYETIPVSQPLDQQDWYVFTSPSNVDAFLEKNSIPEHSKVIAWGKTTEKKLSKSNISPFFVLENSSLRDLESVLRK